MNLLLRSFLFYSIRIKLAFWIYNLAPNDAVEGIDQCENVLLCQFIAGKTEVFERL